MVKASGSDLGNVTKLAVHQPTFMKDHGVRMLGSYPRQQQTYMLQNYYKVIVVKHPFSRLVSMWRDKFLPGDSPYRYKLGRVIMDTVRNRTQVKGGYWRKRPQFHEVMRYLAATNKKDRHWNPYDQFCDPCSVEWDAILRTETLVQESHLLLDKLNLSKELNHSIPLMHSNTKDIKDLYATSSHLPVFRNVSTDAMSYLIATYGADLDQFGYTWDETKHVAKCGIHTHHGY
jgi:hypothetical protein